MQGIIVFSQEVPLFLLIFVQCNRNEHIEHTGNESIVMPSAHGPIFCRKELREKVRVKVRFFLGLSQRRRPIFCRKQLRKEIGSTFSRTKSQRTRTDFLSELLCVTIAGEVSLLDDVTLIFSRTEVRAHGPIFCLKQLREIIGAILHRSKSQRTRTDFHSFNFVRWA